MGNCSVCEKETELACSYCQIHLNTTVYVCSRPTCRDAHEEKCPHMLLDRLEKLRPGKTSTEPEPISTLLFTCVRKNQVLDDCEIPNCDHLHTRQPIWEVVLGKLGKDHYTNQLVFTCFLEGDAIAYQVSREYIVTIRERI